MGPRLGFRLRQRPRRDTNLLDLARSGIGRSRQGRPFFDTSGSASSPTRSAHVRMYRHHLHRRRRDRHQGPRPTRLSQRGGTDSTWRDWSSSTCSTAARELFGTLRLAEVHVRRHRRHRSRSAPAQLFRIDQPFVEGMKAYGTKICPHPPRPTAVRSPSPTAWPTRPRSTRERLIDEAPETSDASSSAPGGRADLPRGDRHRAQEGHHPWLPVPGHLRRRHPQPRHHRLLDAIVEDLPVAVSTVASRSAR